MEYIIKPQKDITPDWIPCENCNDCVLDVCGCEDHDPCFDVCFIDN